MVFQKNTIWVLDDNIDDLKLFKEAFFELNPEYKLVTFRNWKQIITELNLNNVPELLFLDLNLGSVSGFDMIDKIRQHIFFKNVPKIIIYTDSTSISNQQKAFAKGANMYLVKPTSFEDLKKQIKQICTSHFKFF